MPDEDPVVNDALGGLVAEVVAQTKLSPDQAVLAMRSLRHRDVDLEAGLIRIPRNLPITPASLAILRQLTADEPARQVFDQ
ncbi:hypothetical protein [Nocardia colli]|uniref:hypothetical protein n=1 Tax=Nocardia colli TaxID=2545717 RepID=UPI0035E05D6E